MWDINEKFGTDMGHETCLYIMWKCVITRIVRMGKIRIFKKNPKFNIRFVFK